MRATFKKYFIGCTWTDLTYRKKNHHCPIYDYFLRILYTRSKPSPHVYWRFLILPKYLNPQFRRLVSYWEIFRSRKPKFCHNIIQNNIFCNCHKTFKAAKGVSRDVTLIWILRVYSIIFLDKLTCPYNPSPSISCFFSMMFSYFRVIWQVNQVKVLNSQVLVYFKRVSNFEIYKHAILVNIRLAFQKSLVLANLRLLNMNSYDLWGYIILFNSFWVICDLGKVTERKQDLYTSTWSE